MTVLYNEPMNTRSSFRTGGTADTLLLPETEAELIAAVSEYPQAPVLGNLSNTLVTDKGIRGAVILTVCVKGLSVPGGNTVRAACGETLSSLARFAMQNSLTGLEFAHGIPGTVGGGIFMNAGAYGGEIKDVLKSVRLFSPETGVLTYSAEEMKLGYRESVLQHERLIALGADFALEPGDKAEISAKMDELMNRRRAKQPLEYPSCGSTFRRPEGYFAGKLIEDCNLKGCRVGGAEVSEKHAGFVINRDKATSSDILGLISYIKRTVYEKTGVRLEEEIRIIGE